MSDEQLVTVPPVVAPATETADKAAIDPETAKIINSAVTSQLKRLIPKAIEQYEAGRKAAEPAHVEPTKAEAKNPELLAMQRKLEAMEAKAHAATQKARTATLQSELTNSLKGKVIEDWLDIAVKELASKASFSEADEPSLTFGEDQFTISDGVAEFLKDPSNKRFIPAPKSAVNTKQASSNNRFAPVPNPQNLQAMDPLSDEYLAVASAALRAQGGLLGGR